MILEVPTKGLKLPRIRRLEMRVLSVEESKTFLRFALPTMYGTLAFVRIDSRQKKTPTVAWHSDHDRPIFFVELRERYVCSWCEMHDGRLILIPSHESKRRAQHVRYPAEATIVGRVTGVTMDLFDPPESEVRASCCRTSSIMTASVAVGHLRASSLAESHLRGHERCPTTDSEISN